MLWSVIRLIFKTSSVTPDFSYVFNLILSFSTCSQSFKKICAWELLGANVLKRSFFNCSCLLVLDSSARSSAKSRSSNFSVNLHLIPVFPSLSIFLITQSMTSKKRNLDIMHPCQAPDLMSNQPVLPPPSITAHLLPLYIA